MTLWLDVDDLFDYARHSRRLSGVQRLTFEIYRAVDELAPQDFAVRTGYVRIDPATGRFAIVAPDDVLALWSRLTAGSPPNEPRLKPPRPSPPRRGRFTRRAGSGITTRLPAAARPAFQRFCMLQMGAFRALLVLLRELTRRSSYAAVWHGTTTDVPIGRDDDVLPPWAMDWLDGAATPDDWLLSFGASWNRNDYGERVDRLRTDCPIRLALLVYDLIPLRRPEWCHHTLVRDFDRWLRRVLPQADALFAISQATRTDLSGFLREAEVTLHHPIGLLPVGTGFSAPPDGDPSAVTIPESFVLFVSTIEPRKNHQLLVQVWRWLIEHRPARQVPILVFAGRIGWMVEDLIEQLANTHYLGGKVLIIEDPSDELLTELYARCLFTVFPSQFEGWGLPVTESLAHGKPCLASVATSLPEAGGNMARYFDTDDFTGACKAVTDLLDDPDGLTAWTEAVKRDFEPVPWTHSARSVLRELIGREAELADRSTGAEDDVDRQAAFDAGASLDGSGDARPPDDEQRR